MARGRLISRSLGSSRKFHDLLQAGGKLGEFCQVLFPLIVVNCDEHGRMPGDAFTVKNVVLPSSPRPERDFDTALAVMAKVGLLERYAVDTTIFLQVRKFEENQHLNLKNRGASKFPAPCDGQPCEDASAVLRQTPPDSAELRPKRSEEKESEEKGREAQAPLLRAGRASDGLFEMFWAAYPKKKSKDDARRAWDKRRPDAALLQVILTALQQQCQSPDWRKENGRYIPFPATWLNRGQWTDAVDVELADRGLSETLRFNQQASADAERLILDADARRTGTDGHRR